MTLGGLALAVGLLVDEATVAVENLHTHLAKGESVARAAISATRETALPRFMAMLCVVAVFLPALFMEGAARALFAPLAMAVGFSMVASYVLSSTLVPVLSVLALETPRQCENDSSWRKFHLPRPRANSHPPALGAGAGLLNHLWRNRDAMGAAVGHGHFPERR